MKLFLRGNVYQVDVTIDGKRYRRSTGVTLDQGEDLAYKKAKELVEKLKDSMTQRQDEGANKGRIRLSEAIKRTYEIHWSKKKDWKTALQRAHTILEILGDVWVDTITRADVVELQETLMEDRGLTVATVNRYSAALSKILTTVADDLELPLPNRPTIPRFKEPQGRLRYLTPKEEQDMLNYLYSEGHDLYAGFFAVLLDTGMRFAELNGLLFRDISFEHKQIHCWYNKGQRPRTIPMTSRVYKILKKRRREVKGDKPYDLDYWTTRRYFNKAKAHAELEHDHEVTIHTLRHTFASRLVQQGVSLYVVQELLGHSSIQMTQRYSHLNTDTLHKAVSVLER